ncbi:hypothetical protein HYPSUDRAFT_208148 [Hypholoma sublateritium FD-334 SS-4]|uniref:Uncharacterized protein n=1 Tax=Hypholoma sublateritium (strain FD-334 SS-4) TaxID=945553 RepID=A0A0D2P3G7_HYPSF|nr:hypothetical protein HYPSUDRAFT_208148 [Hypholoma sublateritium FD-334 SS-4]
MENQATHIRRIIRAVGDHASAAQHPPALSMPLKRLLQISSVSGMNKGETHYRCLAHAVGDPPCSCASPTGATAVHAHASQHAQVAMQHKHPAKCQKRTRDGETRDALSLRPRAVGDPALPHAHRPPRAAHGVSYYLAHSIEPRLAPCTTRALGGACQRTTLHSARGAHHTRDAVSRTVVDAGLEGVRRKGLERSMGAAGAREGARVAINRRASGGVRRCRKTAYLGGGTCQDRGQYRCPAYARPIGAGGGLVNGTSAERAGRRTGKRTACAARPRRRQPRTAPPSTPRSVIDDMMDQPT